MSFVWGVVVGVLAGGPLVLLVLAFFAGAALEPSAGRPVSLLARLRAHLWRPIPGTPTDHTWGPIHDDHGHHQGYGCVWCHNPWPCTTARKDGRA